MRKITIHLLTYDTEEDGAHREVFTSERDALLRWVHLAIKPQYQDGFRELIDQGKAEEYREAMAKALDEPGQLDTYYLDQFEVDVPEWEGAVLLISALTACLRTFSDRVPQEQKQWTSIDEDALREGHAFLTRHKFEHAECKHCGRKIVNDPFDGWVDPEASGDDIVWREVCDKHDTFDAVHEPK